MSAADLLEPAQRERPRRRPERSPIGYQKWHDLLFIHWRVPEAALRPLLPAELTIDTWGGDAWLGLVAFHMSGVRPWWSPPVPGISSFHETNLRTYVHLEGEPGVWFFSLEAASSLAVRVARWRWRLPYYRARMRIERAGSTIRYWSRRLWPEPAGAECELEAELGGPLTGGDGAGSPAFGPAGEAPAGTLEFFLAERYLLFAQGPSGLFRGQVHHVPYPLNAAHLVTCRETLSLAAGIRLELPPCHAMFSPGVVVDVFPLADAAAGKRYE